MTTRPLAIGSVPSLSPIPFYVPTLYIHGKSTALLEHYYGGGRLEFQSLEVHMKWMVRTFLSALGPHATTPLDDGGN